MSVELRQLVHEAYPEGIQNSDLLSFPISGGKCFYGVEIQTPEVTYLIKGDFAQNRQKNGFVLLVNEEDLQAAEEE